MPDRRTPVAAVRALALGVVLTVAGCGGGSDDEVGERPDLPTEPPALWNPCDGLEPAAVAETFATELTARTGTDSEPVCSFAPTTEGEPAVDVNYQLYPGTLDDLLATFGEQRVEGRTDVASPDVPDADDARVISDVTHGVLFVTGFVRNGQLVQVVNAVDPEPFDRPALQEAVVELLTPLAAHASGSGVSDGDPAPGASPTDDPGTTSPTSPSSPSSPSSSPSAG